MQFRSESGQGVVELAILAPILVLLFLGAIDYGRFFYFQQGISTAARAGADMAMNHCATPDTCGMTDSPVDDQFVIQAAYCAAAPTVALQPRASTCSSCLTVSCAGTSICDSSCLAGLCSQDICISPLAAQRSNGTTVTVSVGYDFQPYSPLISTFFPDHSCWSGDPSANKHTLCASWTGSVY